MYRINLIPLLLILCALWSCQEVDDQNTDFGFDYQPLEVGLFWEYEVEQTIYFGENDSETNNFYFRDKVDYSYLSEEGITVYVMLRERSANRSNWIGVGNYALFVRNNALVRMQDNERVVSLSFPPKMNKSWDSKIYSSNESDEFTIDLLGGYELRSINYNQAVRVLQEMDDDEITFRDNRYEVFVKGIGMIEQFSEVLTYCSRNDCLGQQLVDSGEKLHLKIINYGKI
ncbi:hypothetical protein Belba_2652 [Belliella baltica DSM 15883]|uniref:Uncharacterized protein n=1 Tax=Belliella baltica (strain DSM 15883 / CIP 108006 / LMG 21964 / BA134) TaxID=866536 RepID=I3Z7H9_BELBD|nr:hypothetical protein [Belliella baltica]AFL85197.1 hypothetical protein Belba_2652 [Belliella baltica DSM 15883]